MCLYLHVSNNIYIIYIYKDIYIYIYVYKNAEFVSTSFSHGLSSEEMCVFNEEMKIKI